MANSFSCVHSTFSNRSHVSCVKLDATLEGRRLYEKHGFVDEHAARTLGALAAGVRPLRDGRPRSATPLISLVPQLEDVLALDREFCSAPTDVNFWNRWQTDSPDLVIRVARAPPR